MDQRRSGLDEVAEVIGLAGHDIADAEFGQKQEHAAGYSMGIF